jgi:uncharacterized protein (DUF58 family)
MPSPRPAPADSDDAADRLGLSARPALAVALTGLALTLTGFAIAGPTVAVPGAGLLMLGVLAPMWVLAVLGALHVEARAVSGTVVDGQPLGIEITVTRPRLLGRWGGQLEHDLLTEPVRLRGSGRVELTARARGRGYLTIASPRVTVSDPVGLASGARSARSTVGTLLVLPRTEPVRWLDAGGGAAANRAQVSLGAGPRSIDIAGLRDYQPGTPATRIHWPALARGGELLERVLVTETERAPLLIVDPRCADLSTDAPTLDLVIRAVASLALALARGGAVHLQLPGQATPLVVTASLGTWPSALSALALLPPSALSARPPRVPTGDDGVLYYACTDPALAGAARRGWAGRMLTLSPLSTASSSHGQPTPANVVIPRAGSAPVLEVAGCVARPVMGTR